MMKTRIDSPQRDRWALLRFAIIGSLLAAPPALAALAARTWRYPLTGEPVQFGFSTLERWYYTVRAAENPVMTLRTQQFRPSFPPSYWLFFRIASHANWRHALMAPARQLEHAPNLYEQDFLSWIEEQAQALKARQVVALDWDNLVEEIESMGRSQRNELKSRLRMLLMHLIKWHWQPEKRTTSWELTIKEQRLSLRDLFELSPSLRPTLPVLMPKAWQDASGSAALETGLKEALFPETCPWSIEDVLMDGWLPE